MMNVVTMAMAVQYPSDSFSLHGAGLNISRQSGDKAQKRDAYRNFAKAMPSFARIGLAKSLLGGDGGNSRRAIPTKAALPQAKRYWKRGEVTEIST